MAEATFEELESASNSSANAESKNTNTETTDATKTETAEGAKTVSQLAEQESAAIVDQLADKGVTPDSVDALLGAGLTLKRIDYLIKNDPKAFLDEFRKNDPQGFEKFIDEGAQQYLDYHPAGRKVQSGGKEGGADVEVRAMIRDLRTEVGGLKSQLEAQGAEKHRTTIKAAYETRVTELMEAKEIKELPALEKEFVRLKVDKIVGNDPSALKRLNSGVTTDVAKAFKTAVSELSSTKKAANAKEHSDRGRVTEGAGVGTEVSSSGGAAAGLAGVEAAGGTADIWDEAPLVAALNKSKR